MTAGLSPYDPAEDLSDPADRLELLRDAFATGDAAYMRHALAVVERAVTLARGSIAQAVRGQAALMRDLA